MKTFSLPKPALRTGFCVLAVFALFSCQESPFQPKADFSSEIDPNIPGKVQFRSQSKGAKQYHWQFGYRQSDGTNAYGDYSEQASPVHYFPGNGEMAVQLIVPNGDAEAVITKHLTVSNVPGQVTVTNIVIRRLSSGKADGASFDPEDGSAPDLFFKACDGGCSSAAYVTPDYSKIHVNMNGFALPYTYRFAPDDFHYTGLSPQTRDFTFYVYDFDYYGFGMGTAEVVTMLSFNPYHHTCVYNKGKDENYPARITVNNEMIEADIYLEWQ